MKAQVQTKIPGNRRGVDAFVALGLVSAGTATWNEKVECRLQVLRACQSNIERFAFLFDLQTANRPLFDAVVRKDHDMALIFSEMKDFIFC